jgi:uncharacterized protein with HEPN domain
MSERNISILLKDIVDSGEKIAKYTANVSFDEFKENNLLADAVIRNFEIIGEAVNRLPEEIKEAHSDRLA